MNTLLKAVLRLAGLMHDLGKANAQFQENKFGTSKKRSKAGAKDNEPGASGIAERWRHELLSVLLMYHVLRDNPNDAQVSRISDATGLKRLLEFDTRWGWIPPSDVLMLNAEVGEDLERSAHPALSFMSGSSMALHPVLSTVFWLVLSHHRLPGLKRGFHQFKNTETKFSNLMNRNIERRGECDLALGEAPWENLVWREHLTAAVNDVVQGLNSLPNLDAVSAANGWVLLSTHWLRPLLIAADHIAASTPIDGLPTSSLIATELNASKRKAKSKVKPVAPAMYANKHADGTLGDRLSTHLIRVGALSVALFDQMDQALAPMATIPVDSDLRRKPQPGEVEDPRFVWQTEAETFLAHSDRPTFVTVISETGAGKTLGGVRILSALRDGPIRATFALGQRSLAFQTGDELLNAKFSQNDVSVLVGNPASRAMFEQNRDQAQQNGSESAMNDLSFEVAPFGDTPLNREWIGKALDAAEPFPCPDGVRPSLFFAGSGRRVAALLNDSVLICTIDHLVRGVEATRSTESLASLRAMNADLVLDEVDSYSSSDLISLGKFVMLHGMAGRHVIMMSATMSPVAANEMFSAWQKGIQLRQEMMGKPSNPRSVVVFNTEPYIAIPQGIDISQPTTVATFKAQWKSAVVSLLAALDKGQQRRHFEEWPLSNLQGHPKASSSWGKVWTQITRGAKHLHEENHVLVRRHDGLHADKPATRVSVGFCRFNTAARAAQYAKWVASNQDEEFKAVRVLAYHSKYPAVHMGMMEKELNHLLSRKGKPKNGRNPANLEHSELVQRHLLDAEGNLCSDVILLVCTTTLTETGRDHDYDWCILEPRSVRGEIQAIGRVRRHRPGPWNKVNVLFMETSLRVLDELATPWAYPGIETAEHPGAKTPRFPVYFQPDPGSKIENALTHHLGITMDGKIPSSGSNQVKKAKDGLPLELWKEMGFNARPCLDLPTCFSTTPVGAMEAVETHAFLHDLDGLIDVPSLHAYLSEPKRYAWSNGHATSTRFRSQKTNEDGTVDALQLLDFLGEDALLIVAAPTGKNKQTHAVKWLDQEFVENVNPERIFWRWDDRGRWSEAAHLEELKKRFDSLAALLAKKQVKDTPESLLLSMQMPARRSAVGTPSEWSYRFHPLLGLRKTS